MIVTAASKRLNNGKLLDTDGSDDGCLGARTGPRSGTSCWGPAGLEWKSCARQAEYLKCRRVFRGGTPGLRHYVWRANDEQGLVASQDTLGPLNRFLSAENSSSLDT
jgi:hypothetical protein